MNYNLTMDVRSAHAWRSFFWIALSFIGIFGFLVSAISTISGDFSPGEFLFAVALSAAGAYLVSWNFRLRDRNISLSEQAQRDEKSIEETTLQLQELITIHRELQTSASENELIEKVLNAVKRIARASAVSFIPIDEIGQVEKGVVKGDMPQGVLLAWTEHLAENAVRKLCKVCQVNQNESSECPQLTGPFSDAFRVYCLPLRNVGRVVGMLSIYLPKERQMEQSTLNFLSVILQELGLAIQFIHLRSQEQTTMKQLQLQRGLRHDFARSLEGMLEQLGKVLEMEGGLIRVNESLESPDRTEVRWGRLDCLPNDWQDQFTSIDLSSENPIRLPIECKDGPKFTITIGICQNNVQGGGFIIFVTAEEKQLEEAKLNMLQMASHSVQQLVDVYREMNSVEYRAVIQERIRLAREIHDGLAQTLAFLKLQMAQMQGLLNRGETERLSQALDQNYHTLSEAYLETREVIDNLRLGPQEGFQRALERCISDFETGSGLIVERKLEKLPWEIPVEIQAQIVRIVQEVFSNIRKHSQASQVRVGLRTWDGDLLLDIRDNGIGFSPDDIPELSQYGLRGMQERADMIGADFQITSRPNQGTVVHLRIPSSVLEMFL